MQLCGNNYYLQYTLTFAKESEMQCNFIWQLGTVEPVHMKILLQLQLFIRCASTNVLYYSLSQVHYNL